MALDNPSKIGTVSLHKVGVNTFLSLFFETIMLVNAPKTSTCVWIISSRRSGQQTLMSQRSVFRQNENFSVDGSSKRELINSSIESQINLTHCQSSSQAASDPPPYESTSVIPSEAESSKEQSDPRTDIHFPRNTSRGRQPLRGPLNRCRRLQPSSLADNIGIVVGAENYFFKDNKSINFCNRKLNLNLKLTLSSGVGLICANARARLVIAF